MGEIIETKTFIIKNELGLHARAAAMLARESGRFESKILFEKDGLEVDGRSLLDILTLACPKGARITIRAEGKDAHDAIEGLGRLIEDKFGEN